MVERGIRAVSITVNDPNRGELNPRNYTLSCTWSLQKRSGHGSLGLGGTGFLSLVKRGTSQVD